MYIRSCASPSPGIAPRMPTVFAWSGGAADVDRRPQFVRRQQRMRARALRPRRGGGRHGGRQQRRGCANAIERRRAASTCEDSAGGGSTAPVAVPESAILPGAKGLKAALACLTQARFGIGWGVIGAAMDCYEQRVLTRSRANSSRQPLASHQLVQEKLAWMITEITKAQLLALHCARLKDQDRLEAAHCIMLKRNNATMAIQMRAPQPRSSRRERDYRRVSGDAASVQSGNCADL